jgi:glycosyltransferase involved in cell wall biosynthesis
MIADNIMTSPIASVCICVYNRERYIRSCIESVLAQEFSAYEVVIVDDASTDDTANILASFSHHPGIRIITRNETSGLPAVARNQACRAARGKYLAFLDSDDYWLPGKLDKQVAFMEAHPECGMSHTFCRLEESDGRQLYIRRETDMPRGSDLFRTLLRGNFITTSTVMMRRDLFEQLGGFAEGPDYRMGEDRHLYLRLARMAEIGFVDEVLAVYRKHDDNISGAGKLIDHHVAILRAYRHHYLEERDLIKGFGERRIARETYANISYDAAYHARKKKNFSLARRIAADGWMYYPSHLRLLRQFVLSAWHIA